jgi:hypothetical protein
VRKQVVERANKDRVARGASNAHVKLNVVLQKSSVVFLVALGQLQF